MRAAITVVLFAASALAETTALPPPPRGHWVVDTAGVLTPDTVSQLEVLAAQLDTASLGQLGVLVVRSTDGVAPRAFATEVFNRWGIGHAGLDDGVFLFAALGDRKAEIVLGTGARLTTADTDAVMGGTVVPGFKRGDPNGALRAGASALVAAVLAKGGAAVAPPPAAPPSALHQRLERLARGAEMFTDKSPRHWVLDYAELLSASATADLEHLSNELYAEEKGRLFYLVVRDLGRWPGLDDLVQRLRRQLEQSQRLPLAIVAYDADTGASRISLPAEVSQGRFHEQLIAAAQQKLADAELSHAGLEQAGAFAREALTHGLPTRPMGEVLRDGFQRFAGGLAVAGGVAAVVGLMALRRFLRLRPRTCSCGRPMQRLGEGDDDRHLDSAQRREEGVGSVDYDVWHCGACGEVKVLSYHALFTRYRRCGGCGARTATSSSTTLSSATEYSGGLVRIDTRCANCSHTSSTTRSTARLSSSSRSSSWTSRSSSSSSSSSSFGGGRSSGGGSSGSW